ncbi:MAG: serine/threonine-protein kinase [Thermoleophilaceae bacterium]
MGDADESWELAEGDALAPGRTVMRLLGGGSRYEAFLVWDERLYALAVAKALRPHLAQDDRALRELRDEADAVGRLAHPVIVRGFDAVLDGPRPHLLLEHLEGPNLRRLIRRHGSVPLEQLLPLAAHIAAGLHYMAGEEMVHLDVKPDNIVMGVPPRLIDLSIARSIERAANVRAAIGTDAYMAPEQCRAPGAPPLGPATDVWGLGATLHHAVTGDVPFPRAADARESHDPAVRFPQLSEPPTELPRDLPQTLAEAISRCLAKRPADRPSAADLVSLVEPAIAELPRRLLFGRRGTRTR